MPTQKTKLVMSKPQPTVRFLFRQRWRTAVNRSAEAMTIFAVMCAGLFPLIHMGRPWLAFWVFPYPNGRGPLWINFRSALCWDVFAVSTYFLISLGFWYIGMIPDLPLDRFQIRDSCDLQVPIPARCRREGEGDGPATYLAVYSENDTY